MGFRNGSHPLWPAGVEAPRGQRGLCERGNVNQQINKSLRESLVVEMFFKARTWRHSNIQTGRCSLILSFSPSLLLLDLFSWFCHGSRSLR